MKFKFDATQNNTFLANKKIAIIVANFYHNIGERLLIGAQDTLTQYGMQDNNLDIFYIPGAFEIPLMAKKLAQRYDGIVTLGAVIQGETPHFNFVCNECARGVAKVGYDYDIPIAFGMLTTSNMIQTVNRAGGDKGNKGVEATMAMIEMLYLLDKTNTR